MDLAHEFSHVLMIILGHTSFNPCFNGSCSRIAFPYENAAPYEVSILVLMDLAHESLFNFYIEHWYNVSILVLMDLAHE